MLVNIWAGFMFFFPYYSAGRVLIPFVPIERESTSTSFRHKSLTDVDITYPGGVSTHPGRFSSPLAIGGLIYFFCSLLFVDIMARSSVYTHLPGH